MPQSCLDALDEADKGFLIASDMVGVITDAFKAVANDGADGVSEAVDKLNALTDKLDGVGDTYRTNREDCRDKAAGI